MKLNQRSGFTLLEIIVVIIILGVIAGLALPRLTGNIERSRAMEALNMFPNIRASIDRCILKNSNTSVSAPTDCSSFANLDMPNPNNETSSSFVYYIGGINNFSYTVAIARRDGVVNSYATALAATNRITFAVTADASGNVTSVVKAGNGNFAGI